jgi:FkbM family methyltransferase
MIRHDGFWWPDSDVRGRPAIVREAAEAIPLALEYVSGRSYAIQAGGNVGIYPIGLAQHFDRVLTLEPEPGNYMCLARNVAGCGRAILHHPFALGDGQGVCDLTQAEPDNCGTFQVRRGKGVTMRPIDWFDVPACDLIWLDVEGFEFHVLRGARKTIRTFHPTLILEQKGCDHAFGLTGEETARVLANMGYRLEAVMCNDHLYRWEGQ